MGIVCTIFFLQMPGFMIRSKVCICFTNTDVCEFHRVHVHHFTTILDHGIAKSLLYLHLCRFYIIKSLISLPCIIFIS
jgi:hypothetical protein